MGPRTRQISARAASVAAALLVAGCATPEKTPTPIEAALPVETPIARDLAPVAGLIERYNERIRLVDKTYARGVIEFRWVDRQGEEHFEPQINAKLWIDLPRHTALRGEKLGDIYIWLGSDDERYWMFDLVGDTRRLYIGRHDRFTEQDARSVLVRPVTLIDLLGLTPIPSYDPSAVAFDEDRGVWTVTFDGAGGPTRVFINPVNGRPIRVESLNARGDVALYSELRRDEAVRLSGMSLLALPRMATLIDIANPSGTVSVKLAFGEITGETQANVFDLDRLTEHLRPEQIGGHVDARP